MEEISFEFAQTNESNSDVYVEVGDVQEEEVTTQVVEESRKFQGEKIVMEDKEISWFSREELRVENVDVKENKTMDDQFKNKNEWLSKVEVMPKILGNNEEKIMYGKQHEVDEEVKHEEEEYDFFNMFVSYAGNEDKVDERELKTPMAVKDKVRMRRQATNHGYIVPRWPWLQKHVVGLKSTCELVETNIVKVLQKDNSESMQ